MKKLRPDKWLTGIFCLCLLGSYVWAEKSISGEKTPLIISRSYYDIDQDGKRETIEIVLEKGRRYKDRELWAGNGEKWEGNFLIQVRRGKEKLSVQSLNKLMFPKDADPGECFFWTPEFTLVLKDYNRDGKIDFNLGQYGSSNGNFYRLFTINSNGTIDRLPIKGDEEGMGLFVSPSNRKNSTDLIRSKNERIEFFFYDPVQGKNVLAKYKWNGKEFMAVNK